MPLTRATPGPVGPGGRWWYPGTREGDDAPPPERHPVFDSGFRAHNTNVYPDRPDRVYLAYLDGGSFILDISDTGARLKPAEPVHLPGTFRLVIDHGASFDCKVVRRMDDQMGVQFV